MKKQSSGKNNGKWILLAVILAVVLAAGVLAAVLLTGGSEPEPAAEPVNTKLYWNVDRKEYAAKGMNGASGRMPRSDGYYYVRFAVEGEQIDIPVADRDTVDRIDTFDLMGLVLNEDGVCVDIMQLHEFTGGLATNGYYVESVDGITVTCNTSGLYRGTSTTVEIPQTANIYDVGGQGLLVGIPGDIEPDDQITAIQNADGVITDVFVVPYQMPGDVYWNITRMYDTSAKISTRERSVTGHFEYQMCFGGEIVTVRTRETEIANQMDSFVAKCMGLEFDEDGFVIGTKSASTVSGGGAVASWFHVTAIDGDQITAEKIAGGSDQGTVTTVTAGRYCKTVLTSTGEYTQVQVGDQVHCLTDSRGRLAYIFIISRPSPTAKVYWNVDRQYDSTNKVTKRTPSGGYYYFDLAVDGEQVTLKTKDKAIATKMDSYAGRCFALEVEGDEIISVNSTGYATGGSVVLSWYHVDSLENGYITGTKRTDENSAEYGMTVTKKMAQDCKVYNVSSSAIVVGEETTVKVDDQIHCMTNYKGEIQIVFVVSRPVSSRIYYNLERLYDSEKKETKRERAEDGYFYFLMAVDGKQVTLKTKDKELASQIDASAARCMGLSLKGDVILKMYSTSSVKGYTGGVEVSYCDVTAINGRTVKAEKLTAGPDLGSKYTVKMTANCKVYDVSGAHTDHAGEATTLRVGDRIHCLRDENKNTVLIYVVARKIQGKVGWNVKRQYDSENKTTTRVPDEEGWYYIDMAIDGQVQTLKTQDITLINAIDATAAMCRGLVLEGDVIKRVVAPSSVIGTDGGVNGSWVNVTEVTDSGCKAIKVGGTEDGTTYDIPMAKDCKVYNVSSTYKKNFGEETTLKYGAVIHALINTDGDATIIYVITDGIEGATQGYCNVCQQNVTWAAWNGSDVMVSNVHYYLEEDIHMDTYTTVSGSNVTLFLNGHTITSDSRAFKLMNSAVLNIYDSKEDGKDIGGKIVAKGITADEIVAENNGNASEGGVVMMWNSNVTLNLYSGTMQLASENNGVKNGGVVSGAGVFNMYGGSVIGSKVTNHGGSVRLFGAKAQFNLYDGTVSGGQAVQGGNITADNGATVNIKGGTVTGGIALSGTADVNGGNLYLIKSAANISGGTITGGQAAHGGNIAVTGVSTLTMTGGSVTDGKAITLEKVGNGGNIYVSGGEKYSYATITGGTITGGQARRGGNIAAFGGVSVSDTTLDSGWASHDGACFFTYSLGELSLKNVTVPAPTEGVKSAVQHSGTALVLSGKVTLAQVNVSTTVITIGQDGLDDASSVQINDTDITTSFATVPEAADKDCFHSVSEEYAVEMDESMALYLKSTVVPHVHCECGGQAVGIGDHTACQDEEWVAWSDASKLPTTSGNYYLTTDVSFSTGITTAVDSDINLCLNGHTIRNNERIWLRGNLALTDCDGGGAIISTFARHSAIFYTYERCQLRLYAGTLSGSGAGQKFGVVTLCNDDTNGNNVREPSYCYMYGGTIIGRNAGTDNGGGAVHVMLNAQFHMYGGTITGGQALKGGAIFAADPTSVVNIQGGTITGNRSDQGGAIYGDALGASITISGDAQITGNTNAAGTAENNVYLKNDQTLQLGELAESARVGVTMAQPGDIAANVTKDVSSQVISDSGDYKVVYDEAAQKLTLQADAAGHSHCLCNGRQIGDHTVCTQLSWTPLTQAMFDQPDGTTIQKVTVDISNTRDGMLTVYLLASGNYYLDGDITLEHMIQLNKTTVNLCLNGNTLTSGSRAFRLTNSCVLSVTDCGEDGQLVGKGASDAEAYEEQGKSTSGVTNNEGGVVMMWSNTTTYNLFGGTVRLASVEEGGSTAIVNGGVISGSGVMNMYGGAVRDGRAMSQGGNIRLWSRNTGSLTMYGGAVENGQAINGGNIAVDGGTGTQTKASLYGGTVMGGQATGNGEDVYLTANGYLTLGGTVQITEVYLPSGKTLTVAEEGFREAAKVGIRLGGGTGTIAANVTTDLSGWFESTNDAYQVKWENNTLVLK